MDLGKVPLIDWIFSFKNLTRRTLSPSDEQGQLQRQVHRQKSYQFLSDESIEMLKRSQTNTCWISSASHPDFIAKDK
jgi:hypothetical protein